MPSLSPSLPASPSISPVPRRRLAALLAGLGAALLLPAAQAHGPTRQKVSESIAIAAPADKVWAVVGAYDGLAGWHPAVAESPADKGNAVGSIRTVKIKGGGELIETLEAYDAAAMKLSYRAKNGGALPVTNYSSQISVRAEGSGAVVEWRGAFYRGYPNNDPPPDQNDEAAVKAVTGVYKSGLAALKAKLEGK